MCARAREGRIRAAVVDNQLLVALSCPEATVVAGFKAWLSLGYCVRQGENAIRIIAPMPIKPRRGDHADNAAAFDENTLDLGRPSRSLLGAPARAH